MQALTAGGKNYDLYWTNGLVEETGKNMETRVSGGGGANNTNVQIHSHTVIHDQIFLTDNGGKEHSFQLSGFNVACRTGNDLSVLWAIKEGKKTGPYIAVYNHSTKQGFFADGPLKRMFCRNGWLLLGAIILSLILGSKLSGFFIFIAFLLPMAWLIEGSMGAKKFKNETDFSRFK
ncbi:hypothetical protein BH11BAC3_BH11BAC3_46290 [soil metagenome]